jgi:peptide/nickel transport system substrate-binding protein
LEDQHLTVKYTSFGMTCALEPLPCFVYQYFADGKKIIEEEGGYPYRTSSIWAQNFSNHFAKNVIVCCGPFLFAGMNEEGIKFKRNPKFYDPLAVLIEEYHIVLRETVDAIWQDFKAKKIDLCYLSPNQLLDYKNFLNSTHYKKQKAAGYQINEFPYVEKAFFYIGWNEKKPFFQNKNLRQALTLAIDRRRIVEQNLNNMGILITGPFSPTSLAYDHSLSPFIYDPEEAVRLIEEEGWFDKDGDGIREKMVDGKKTPFKFTMTYYVKNISTKVICEYVATSLRSIGIGCDLYGVDLPDLSRNFEDKTFDAVFLGWSVAPPPEDPELLWHSALADKKGSANAIGFSNREADQIIEQLHYEYDPEKRKSLYHRFHEIIHEEAPYTFLYSPKRVLLCRDNVKNLFIPALRTDLIPDAQGGEPEFRAIWINL